MDHLQSNAKTFFRFAGPSVASMIIFSLYTMIDGVFLSHAVGEYALTAVNIALPYINGIFALAILFAMGTSTVVAIAMGHGETERANRVFTQNLWVLAVISAVISILVQLFTKELALFLGATESTFDFVVQYLRVVSPFSIFFIVGYAMEVLVKTGGHPEVSLKGLVSCFIVNIALHAVLVLALDMGITGAAIATGVAQGVAFAVFLVHFASGKSNLRLVRLKKPFLSIYRRIIPLGLSDFANEVSLAVVVIIFNKVTFRVAGESGVVAYAVIQYINNIAVMIYAGVAQGMQPLVSLAYGAGDKRGCLKFYSLAQRTILVCSLVCFGVCFFATAPVVSLLLESSSAAFDETVRAVRLFSISFLMAGFNICSAGFFNATTKPVRALSLSLSRGIVLITASIYIMSELFGITGTWLSPVVSEGLCLIMNVVFVVNFLLTHRHLVKDGSGVKKA